MFIVILTYTAPLDEIDNRLDDHAAWLDENFAAGVFMASGRRNPRTGGVILAAGVDRAALQDAVDRDPFHVSGLAKHDIIEFLPNRVNPELIGSFSTPST